MFMVLSCCKCLCDAWWLTQPQLERAKWTEMKFVNLYPSPLKLEGATMFVWYDATTHSVPSGCSNKWRMRLEYSEHYLVAAIDHKSAAELWTKHNTTKYQAVSSDHECLNQQKRERKQVVDNETVPFMCARGSRAAQSGAVAFVGTRGCSLCVPGMLCCHSRSWSRQLQRTWSDV
jgi:hypothetical protein